MKNKLHSIPGFKKARENYNVIDLVQLIQVVTFNFEKHTYLYDLLNDIQQKNCHFFQQRGWTLMDYLEKYLDIQI